MEVSDVQREIVALVAKIESIAFEIGALQWRTINRDPQMSRRVLRNLVDYARWLVVVDDDVDNRGLIFIACDAAGDVVRRREALDALNKMEQDRTSMNL